MRIFDRIILVMLALGVWALVLSPRSIEAHHIFAIHDCSVSGIVGGQVSPDGAVSIDATGLSVECGHRAPVQTF